MDTLKPSLIGELLSRFDDLLAEAQYPRECVASVPPRDREPFFPERRSHSERHERERRRKWAQIEPSRYIFLSSAHTVDRLPVWRSRRRSRVTPCSCDGGVAHAIATGRWLGTMSCDCRAPH